MPQERGCDWVGEGAKDSQAEKAGLGRKQSSLGGLAGWAWQGHVSQSISLTMIMERAWPIYSNCRPNSAGTRLLPDRARVHKRA